MRAGDGTGLGRCGGHGVGVMVGGVAYIERKGVHAGLRFIEKDGSGRQWNWEE